MTHPFAGGIPYPWERSEASWLAEVLRSQVTQVPRIDMLYKSAAGGLPALNTGQAPALLWAEALGCLALADALLTFCNVLTRQADLPAVAAAAQARLDAKPAYQRRIGASGRLVADRITLREELGELARPDGPVKVVLVRGDEKSGKSWSRHLFEAAAFQKQEEINNVRNAEADAQSNRSGGPPRHVRRRARRGARRVSRNERHVRDANRT